MADSQHLKKGNPAVLPFYTPLPAKQYYFIIESNDAHSTPVGPSPTITSVLSPTLLTPIQEFVTFV